DPDVIMVGEIRDKETAEMAIHAALTGHLVLTTLHTNNAAGAIPRLVDMGIEPFLIASAVNLVVAQRLVRRLCPYGKVEEKIPPALYERVEKILREIPPKSGLDVPPPPYRFYRGIEDSRCHQGYLGRIGVFETIEISEEIQSLITQNVRSAEIMRVARKEGMVTMFEDALVKAVKAITSLEEALRVSIMGIELKEQF
ncbi:Flp pilus assembly complex ATPase component TadA, partial [bacterium]|nr:Flp pilus assembly complex ATPase component TadA [bacterium]